MLGVKSLVLSVCLLSSAGGCNPKQDPTGPRPAETLTATEIAGIRLTYMCGNTFRVRNPNEQEAPVTWDVYNTGETGSLTLPPKPAGAAHSETFFTTLNKGTVRLFYNSQLIQTKANGNKPPCQTGGQQPADWPQLSELPILDTTKLLTLPNDTAKIFRTELVLAFDPEVADSAKQAILNRFGLTVIGVTWAKTFFVRFSDRGPSIEAYRAFQDSLNAWPGVHIAVPINFTPLEEVADSRYPSDGVGQGRADWFTTTNDTWAGRAIRSTLAWGCENGNYGGDIVPVGVLEWKHDGGHPEFAASTPKLWEPNDNQLAKLGIQPKHVDTVAARVLHATQVVGTLTAEGDNGSGVAGVMWKTDLHLYAMYSSGNRPTDIITGFYQVTDRIRQDGIRVVSMSADGVLTGGLTQQEKELQIEEVALYLREVLNASPQLTIVVAAGNDRFRGTYAAYVQTPQPAVLRAALLKLRGDPRYNDRIVVVTGMQQNNAFWNSWYLRPTEGANFFSGLTDVAAPAQDIVTLGRRTGSSVPITAPVIAGTSLAAPMVAGVAAQLLAMNPSLTPAQVKDYIIRGAKEPKQDPGSGAISPAGPVTGAPEPVYQLDAYGALTLLSKERQGTPICGLETWTLGRFDPNTFISTWTLFIGRNSLDSLVLPVPSAGGVSVAQGGRLLSIHAGTNEGVPYAQPFRLIQGRWEPQASNPSSHIYYLERDTAYVRPTWGNHRQDIWVRIGSHYAGRSEAEKRVTTAAPGQDSENNFSHVQSFAVAPTGDWFVFNWMRLDGLACHIRGSTQTGMLYAVSLRGGSTQTVLSNQQDVCAGGSFSHEQGGPLGWRGDGSAFIAAQLMNNGQERTHPDFRLRRFNVSSSTVSQAGATVDQSVAQPLTLSWQPEGGRIEMLERLSSESGLDTCDLVVRRASNFDVLSRTRVSPIRCAEQRSIQPAVRVASTSK